MGLPSVKESLWKVALECAIKRRDHKCENEFDSPICSSCKFYIKNYMDEDPRKIKLFMMNAEDEAEDIRRTLKRANRSILYIVLFIIGFFLVMGLLL